MDDAPEVTTKSGALRGCLKYAVGSSKPVYTFLGVPYAKPPLGDLRLRSPVPPDPWTGVRDATTAGLGGPQDLSVSRSAFKPFQITDERTSEDCLFVNIYSPNLHGKRPVLFWIYGGAFKNGTAHLYDGTAYAALEDLVVVTIGYRLGALGFLCTGNTACPGNLGLLDLIAGLQWVAANIPSFGGHPSCVTIAGQSAGGRAVELLMLSPLAEGLFHRAISQSGSALVPNYFSPTRSQATFHELAKKIGCDTTDGQALVDFLRETDVDTIINNQEELAEKGHTFVPCVDGHVLPRHPNDLYRSAKINKVPYMVGMNGDEGYYFATTTYPPSTSNDFNRAGFLKYLQIFLPKFYPKSPLIQDILRAVVFTHTAFKQTDGWTAADWRGLASGAFGDAFVTAPATRSAISHTPWGKTFMYVFPHKPSFSSSSIPVATHSEDLMFSWGEAFMDRPASNGISFTEEERTLSRNFMKLWANFVRHGDPNVGNESMPYWPEFNPRDEKYLELDTQIEVKAHFKHNEVKVWNETVRQMHPE